MSKNCVLYGWGSSSGLSFSTHVDGDILDRFIKMDSLLFMDKQDVSLIYLRMAQYVANQCGGCSDSPTVLAIKAQKAMLEAHDRQENPIQCLNDFLGTNIAEEVLLSLL